MPAVRPTDVRRLIQTAVGDRVGQPLPGPRDRVVPERVQLLRRIVHCLSAGALGAAASAHAARPFVTDDARVVDPGGYQIETFLKQQRAFHERHALQCGFCTPGFLLAAEALLRERPDPSEREVREALAGNLCRCTGYEGIVEAVLDVARAGRAEA